jgi:hypothetical protein
MQVRTWETKWGAGAITSGTHVTCSGSAALSTCGADGRNGIAEESDGSTAPQSGSMANHLDLCLNLRKGSVSVTCFVWSSYMCAGHCKTQEPTPAAQPSRAPPQTAAQTSTLTSWAWVGSPNQALLTYSSPVWQTTKML